MQKEKFCSLLLPSMCFSLVTDTSNDPPVDKRHMHIHALPTSSFLDCYIYLSLLRGEKIKRLTTHPSVSAPRPAAFFFFPPLDVLNNTHCDKVTSRNSRRITLPSCWATVPIIVDRHNDLWAPSDLILYHGIKGSTCCRLQLVKDKMHSFKLTNQRSIFPENLPI